MRDMMQYDKEGVIENESLKLDKKLEKEASYINSENKEKLEQSLQNLEELNLTEEQQAELDSLLYE